MSSVPPLHLQARQRTNFGVAASCGEIAFQQLADCFSNTVDGAYDRNV
jgi:hypothetical protein